MLGFQAFSSHNQMQICSSVPVDRTLWINGKNVHLLGQQCWKDIFKRTHPLGEDGKYECGLAPPPSGKLNSGKLKSRLTYKVLFLLNTQIYTIKLNLIFKHRKKVLLHISSKIQLSHSNTLLHFLWKANLSQFPCQINWLEPSAHLTSHVPVLHRPCNDEEKCSTPSGNQWVLHSRLAGGGTSWLQVTVHGCLCDRVLVAVVYGALKRENNME